MNCVEPGMMGNRFRWQRTRWKTGWFRPKSEPRSVVGKLRPREVLVVHLKDVETGAVEQKALR